MKTDRCSSISDTVKTLRSMKLKTRKSNLPRLSIQTAAATVPWPAIFPTIRTPYAVTTTETVMTAVMIVVTMERDRPELHKKNLRVCFPLHFGARSKPSSKTCYPSICLPRNPAAVLTSFISISPNFPLFSRLRSATAPIASPSQMIGATA